MATDSITQLAANFEHYFLCTHAVYMTTMEISSVLILNAVYMSTTNGIYQIFSVSIINAVEAFSRTYTSLKALKATTHIIQG